MASQRICQSCLRTLHQQVRRNHHRVLGKTLPETVLFPRYPDRSRQTFESLRSFASTAVTVETPPPSPPPAHAGSQEAISQKAEQGQPAGNESEEDVFKKYDAIDATEILFKECASQGDYIIPQAFERKGQIPKSATGEDIGEGSGWWYEGLKLTPTFNTWAQITFLHMYLLTVRFRYLASETSHMWQQHLHDHFFWECEHRMNIFHGMTSRSIRNRNLKELYNQWRGVLGAYDEGLVKGDAVLATAVWRNIFKADEQVDWRDVALITSFMRRGLRALDRAPDRIIASSAVRFGSPLNEKAVVLKPSASMSKGFNQEDDQVLRTLLESESS